MSSKEEVKDRGGVVYVIFVLLGCATLFPWNVFLTEAEFYAVRFQVKPYNAFVAENFMPLFGVSFNTLNLLCLAFLVKYQKQLSLRVLVLQPLIITFIMLASTAALALKTDVPGDQMAKYTLPSIGLMGLCTAMLQVHADPAPCTHTHAHTHGTMCPMCTLRGPCPCAPQPRTVPCSCPRSSHLSIRGCVSATTHTHTHTHAHTHRRTDHLSPCHKRLSRSVACDPKRAIHTHTHTHTQTHTHTHTHARRVAPCSSPRSSPLSTSGAACRESRSEASSLRCYHSCRSCRRPTPVGVCGGTHTVEDVGPPTAFLYFSASAAVIATHTPVVQKAGDA
jgi:hypothetical protein